MKFSFLQSVMQTEWAPWAISAALHVAVPFAIGGLFTESPRYAIASPVAASGAAIQVSVVTLEELHEADVDVVHIPNDQVQQIPIAPPEHADVRVEKKAQTPPKRRVSKIRPQSTNPVMVSSQIPSHTDTQGQGSLPPVGPIASGSTDIGVATPDYLRNAPPPYPRESRRAGEQGTVLLSVGLSGYGDIEEIALRESSGFGRLDEAALKAVRGWRFKPARVAGVGVASSILVPVRFVLR